jgi:hypothetical protein
MKKVKYYIWGLVVFGGETWTLPKVDQKKNAESFET